MAAAVSGGGGGGGVSPDAVEAAVARRRRRRQQQPSGRWSSRTGRRSLCVAPECVAAEPAAAVQLRTEYTIGGAGRSWWWHGGMVPGAAVCSSLLRVGREVVGARRLGHWGCWQGRAVRYFLAEKGGLAPKYWRSGVYVVGLKSWVGLCLGVAQVGLQGECGKGGMWQRSG